MSELKIDSPVTVSIFPLFRDVLLPGGLVNVLITDDKM